MGDERESQFKLSEFVYGGTKISSRYNKFSEIRHIVKALDAVDEKPWRKGISVLWCDSKADSVYAAECQGVDADLKEIARELGRAFFEKCGGHNGIFVVGENVPDEFADPQWDGDEE